MCLRGHGWTLDRVLRKTNGGLEHLSLCSSLSNRQSAFIHADVCSHLMTSSLFFNTKKKKQAEGLIAVWFQLVAAFSMTPLLAKDGQLTAYMACSALFFAVSTATPWSKLPSVWSEQPSSVVLLFFLSIAGMIAVHVAELFVEPPANLPHIFPLIVCGYSFLHYFGFFVYFHWRQFASPRVDEVAVFRARQKTE